jgi:hypothetical protein
MLDIFVERVSWCGSYGELTKQMPGFAAALVLVVGVAGQDLDVVLWTDQLRQR